MQQVLDVCLENVTDENVKKLQQARSKVLKMKGTTLKTLETFGTGPSPEIKKAMEESIKLSVTTEVEQKVAAECKETKDKLALRKKVQDALKLLKKYDVSERALHEQIRNKIENVKKFK